MITTTEIAYFITNFPCLSGFYFFFMGASIGSFLHFIAYRIGKGMSVSDRSSQCDSCGAPIKRRYNVPVLGYLALRGKTACCNRALSKNHIFIEIMFGSLSMITLLFVGTSTTIVVSLGVAFVIITTLIADLYRKSFTDESFWVLLCSLLFVSGVLFDNTLQLLMSAFVSRIFLYYVLDMFDKRKYINWLSILSVLILVIVLR